MVPWWGVDPALQQAKPARILLVEDNPPDIALIEGLLEATHATFRLQCADRLEEGRRLLAERAFDVILLDLSLPDATTEETVHQLRAHAGDVPIVVLTGMPGMDRRAFQDGAEEFLSKDDLTAATLSRAIEQAVLRSKARELRRRLQEADRMAAIGRLAAGVAHDLNNPAMFIQANAVMTQKTCAAISQMLSSNAPDVEQIRSMVAELEEMANDSNAGVDRIARITRELSAFSRREDERLERVDVRAVCRTACSVIGPRIDPTVRFQIEVTDVPPVWSDPTRLGQALLNVLSNAAQAVSARHISRRTIFVGATVRDGDVSILVEDRGIGIPAGDLDRIFDPFFTTKGTDRIGLGLAMARDMLASSGGKLKVRSTEGEGTVVELRLRSARVAASESPAEPRILIVDDEEMLLRALARMLRNTHDVVTACGGSDALDLLREDSAFDAVVCDLMMPNMGGREVFARVQEIAPHLCSRFVFVTGGALTETADLFLSQTAPQSLSKPLRQAELVEAIEAVIQNKSASRS